MSPKDYDKSFLDSVQKERSGLDLTMLRAGIAQVFCCGYHFPDKK